MTLDPSPLWTEPQGAGAPVDQLLYRSLSRDGAESALKMSDILAEARPANARNGITGVLTAVNGRFVQIVEGSSAALDGLLAKLLRDPRHSDLVVIERRASRSRLFSDWDMVSPRLAPNELSLLALLLEDERAGIDAFAGVLSRAVAQQEAVLEGRCSPRGGAGSWRSTPDRSAESDA
ncbi:MAG: BLUF domain-containing protein [Pseudomonadota bacterium]